MKKTEQGLKKVVNLYDKKGMEEVMQLLWGKDKILDEEFDDCNGISGTESISELVDLSSDS